MGKTRGEQGYRFNGGKMSNKVKDRLRKLQLEMTHEERVELDKALENLYLKRGGILITLGKVKNGKEIITEQEKACDIIIDDISDGHLIELVGRIKRKKKKQVLVEAGA
jgi:hypothetical protein